MSIIVKPECRCCDCKNLGVNPATNMVVCEGPIPSVWADAADDIEMDLTAADVLKIRRCDCFEPRGQ